MSIRRTGLLLLAIVALAPRGVSASGHDADLSLGGCCAFGSKLGLFHSTVAWTIPTAERPRRFAWVLSDFTAYKGKEDSGHHTLFGYMTGGRVTFAMHTDQQDGHKKIELSAHGLIGATHTKGGHTVRSGAVGGAVDYLIGKHLSTEGGCSVRGLVDYVMRNGDEKMWRVSGEFVVQVARKHKH